MSHYNVLTGIRSFNIEADSPKAAIARLKEIISTVAYIKNPYEIGQSLIISLREGKLNFLVLNNDREVLAGEYKGTFTDNPKMDLINAFMHMIPEELYKKYKAKSYENS